MFIFELIDFTFITKYISGLELVGTKDRVKVNALMGCFYPVGGVIMGWLAYMIQDWRIMLRILYTPALLLLGSIW